ncbi:MAG: Immunogenic protein [uncultured Sulfurovum sp.]|uniref:Immunogenic protein n=1 Tax=uncultured Sulfurovum sp. TaxID=269237 RepID=A0A6S6S2X3_9BACT|nr:MAG: Immunogenic protein [uncultured Sulfurovum sp.]
MKTLKLILIFIILVLLPMLYVALDSNDHKKSISIAIGSKVDAYNEYALQYAKELKKEGVSLKLVETKGSVEAQEKLLNGEVDFAFVQGGTEAKNILALANIMLEPIWIFYKGRKISDLKSLKGKRIAICEKGSGILPVTLDLLDLVGINGFNSKLLHVASDVAYENLKNNEIDAMFYIASADAPFLRKLMTMPNVHLMNFAASESYKQFFVKRNKHFEIVTLHENAFDMKQHIPRKRYKLLAKNTLLATYNASNEMVRLMLKIANRVHRKVGVFHKENDFPNASLLKVNQHHASKEYFREKVHYYEKNFSFWIAQSLNKLHDYTLRFIFPLVALFAFFIEVMVPAFNLYGQRKINRWYDRVNQIDNMIATVDLKHAKERREKLKKILAEIRATDDIAANHMADFYTLQNQIVNILDALEKRIKTLHQGHKKF